MTLKSIKYVIFDVDGESVGRYPLVMLKNRACTGLMIDSESVYTKVTSQDPEIFYKGGTLIQAR